MFKSHVLTMTLDSHFGARIIDRVMEIYRNFLEVSSVCHRRRGGLPEATGGFSTRQEVKVCLHMQYQEPSCKMTDIALLTQILGNTDNSCKVYTSACLGFHKPMDGACMGRTHTRVHTD